MSLRPPKHTSEGLPFDLTEYRHGWRDIVGASTIPLLEGKKEPFQLHWETRPSEELWEDADTQHSRLNIGVRLGELQRRSASLVAIDLDSTEARNNVTDWLEGVGLKGSARVKTARRGRRHVYLLVNNVPEAFSYKHLSPSVGDGELRAGRGSYVVAPCSFVKAHNNYYYFEEGNHYTLASQPVISWRDLEWLLPSQTTGHVPDTASHRPPVSLQYRPIQPHTIALLQWLKQATRGQGIYDYKTRSEVECAVITQLLLSGFTTTAIERKLTQYQSGHYMDYPKEKRRAYLMLTLRNVVTWLSDVSPVRLEIASQYAEASNLAWTQGSAAPANQQVIKALLSQCWRMGSKTVYASCRTLAEISGCTAETVSVAIKRLEKEGYLITEEPFNRKKRLPSLLSFLSLHGHYDAQKPDISHSSKGVVRNSGSKQLGGKEVENTAAADSAPQSAPADVELSSEFAGLFGYRGGLLRSSGMVYQHLDAQPKTNKQLTILTGLHRNTIATCLAELRQYGLAEETKDAYFVKGKVSQNAIALKLGIGTISQRKRQSHTRDRYNWNKWMDIIDAPQEVPIPASQERF